MKIRTAKIQTNKYKDYRFNIFIKQNEMIKNCIMDCKSKKRIVISSTGNKKLTDMFRVLITEQYELVEDKYVCKYPKNILLINSTGLLYFNPNEIDKCLLTDELFGVENIYKTTLYNKEKSLMTESELKKYNEMKKFDMIQNQFNIRHTHTSQLQIYKQQFLMDLNDMIRNKYSVDIFMYSPSIKTGISFNSLKEETTKKYFDKQYSFGLCGSVCVREYIQMLFRVRELTDKEININLGGKYKQYITPINTETTKRFMKFNNGLFKLNKTKDNEWNDLSDLTEYIENETNTDYIEFRSINKTEYYNSIIMFNQEFFRLMNGIHNFTFEKNFRFIETKEDTKEIYEVMDETKTERQNKECELFINTDIFNEFLTFTEYSKIKDLMEEQTEQSKQKITNEMYRKLQKYKKLIVYNHYEPIKLYVFLKEEIDRVEKEIKKENEYCDSSDSEEELEPNELLYRQFLLSPKIQLVLEELKHTIDTFINSPKMYFDYISDRNNGLMKNILTDYKYDKQETNENDIDIEDPKLHTKIAKRICEYLDITDLDKSYKFVNETHKKSNLTGLKQLLYEKEINECNCIDYINKYILPIIDNEVIKSLTISITGNQLDISKQKDYKSVIHIIKYFLSKVNMEIVYNSTQYYYKTTELTIQPKDNMFMFDRENYELNKTPYKTTDKWRFSVERPLITYEKNPKKSITYYRDIVNETTTYKQKPYIQSVLYIHNETTDIIDIYGDCEVIHTNINNITPKKSRNGKKILGYMYNNKLYQKDNHRYILNNVNKPKMKKPSRDKDSKELDLEVIENECRDCMDKCMYNCVNVVNKYRPQIFNKETQETYMDNLLNEINRRYGIVDKEYIDFTDLIECSNGVIDLDNECLIED